MRSIFSRYYKEDKDVTEDVELQTYVNEVSFNGSGPNGGLGRVINMTINHKTQLGCRLRGLILVYTFCSQNTECSEFVVASKYHAPFSLKLR